MAKKPIFKTLWAERGAKEEVDSSKIAVGWTAERPPFQWENWSQWRQDAFISHINEKGLPEWDDFTAYGTSGKSYVLGSNGEVYVSTAPSGGTYPASDPSDATTTKWKKAWLDSDGTIGIPRVVGLVAALDNKVDKVAGKALSVNDFTNAYKGKLDGIESNAQRNVATNLSSKRAISSVTLESSTGEGTTIPTASASLAGVLSGTDKAKLDSLPSGVSGIVPLSGGGTGSSNAAGARLALQLGNHSTHNYGTTANTVMMGNDPRVVRVNQDIAEGLETKADKTINISAGTGLVGGGNLSANRALSTVFGTAANTSAMGNDSRIVNAASKTELSSGLATKADKTINISTGVGLVGGGNLSTNRTISTNFGTTANTVAMGNDSRIINGQTSFERLDIGKTAATARTALGLGAQATRWPSLAEVTGKPTHYPTTWGSVAAKPVQATRWPTWSEVGGKPVQQGLGNSSTDIMSQKAITDAIGVVRGLFLGEGQTWQRVTASRSIGTTYTNTTGRTIVVSVTTNSKAGVYMDANVSGVVQFAHNSYTNQLLRPSVLLIVPAGNTYRVTSNSSLHTWAELR